MVITGGGSKLKNADEDIYDLKSVEIYDANQNIEDLPEMNMARRQHGCSNVEFATGEKGKYNNFLF